jgi:hypothetical protein
VDICTIGRERVNGWRSVPHAAGDPLSGSAARA